MNTPTFNTKSSAYRDHWGDVEHGRAEPGEYHIAMMNIVQAALDSGIHYTTDVYGYVREHADFIPAAAWDLQYSMAVEGGVMGMEIYSARASITAKTERDANTAALQSLAPGQALGTLSVNGKRVNKCALESIDGYTLLINGKTGKYRCSFHVDARHIPGMIERAVQRGWRNA